MLDSLDVGTCLQRVAAGLVEALTANDVIRLGVHEAGAALGAPRRIACLVGDDDSITVVDSVGIPAALLERHGRFRPTDALPIAEVVRTGAPLFIESTAESRSACAAAADGDQPRVAQAWSIFPMRAGARVLGALAFGFDTERACSPAERALVAAIAQQCAQALDRTLLLERAAREAERLQRLQSVTAALAKATTPREIVGAVLGGGPAAVGATAAVICRLDAREQMVDEIWGVGYPDDALDDFRHAALTEPFPTREVARTREPVFVESEAEWRARYREPTSGLSVAPALAVLPLLVGERLVGVLGLRFAAARPFPDDERALLMGVARQCAQALERARLFEAEHAARARLERLQEVTATLGEASTEAEVNAAMMTSLAGVLRPDTAAMYVATRDDDGVEWLEMLGSNGLAPRHANQFARFRLDADVPLCEVVRDGEPAFLGTTPEFAARYPRWPIAERATEGFVALPLLGVHGARLGAVVFGFAGPRAFADEERRLASAIARQGAQALERAQLLDAERRARADAVAEAARVRELQELTEALSAALTPDEVAAIALERARPAFGAAAGLLNLLTEDGAEFVSLRTYGFTDEVMRGWRRYPVRIGTPGSEVVATGAPVYVETLDEGVRRFPALADTILRAGYPAFVCLPLWHGARALGIVSFNFAEERVFRPGEREHMRAFAGQCALALSRARLYEAERAARGEAEVANQAKMQFLATMSHELRTPLNAIAGYADILELEIPGPLTGGQRESIGRIRRSQRHLLSLINDVLDFARIDAGRVHAEIGDVPIASLLEDLEPLVAPQLRARELRYRVAPAAPELVARADAERTRQVLLNLLSNAAKFSPPGSEIVVRARRDGGWVLVDVQDQGAGIPAGQLEQVFEPFVQLGRTLTSGHEGTGLGLAISRDLARLMDGDLVATSEAGQGATFTLRLPAV